MTFFALILLLLLLATIFVAWRLNARLVAADRRHVRELEAQRAQFEAAQEADRARVETMLDGMIEGLVVIDTERRIVLANRAAEEMFGFSRMMAGGTVLEALRHHDVAAIAMRAIAADSAIEQEVRLERPALKIIQVSAVALHRSNGESTGAVIVFRDVTRLRELEAIRQDFVANVSHELRTPLSLIKSAAETLLDGGRNDPAVTARFLEIIDRHASRLTLLLDDLLLLARLDSGRVELELQDVSLRALAQETIDDASLLARGRGVTLTNEVPASLAARADPAQLRQVFGNLVNNAIKYGRADGHVTIGGRAVTASVLEIAVRDDGPGIPAEAKDRVFERFYRIDKARSREQGGTGLGLAIVKNVVQAHGGDVRVESTVGEGATFFFTLPAVAVKR